MDLLIVVALVVVVAVVAVVAILVIHTTNAGRDEQARQRAEELTAVKKVTDEDVTALGEQLRMLDTDLAGRELDDGKRADYQRALDSYESAKQAVGAMRAPEDVRYVTEILEDGRYAIDCVRARVSGDPLPSRRAPCFFDPRHGPSVENVAYAPEGGTSRDVPACALDADRIKSGADPDVRTVMSGPQRVPYWEGGRAYAPYTAGYFSAFGIMPTLFMGTMMGAMLGEGFEGAVGSGDTTDAGDDGGDAWFDGGFDIGDF